MPSTFFLVSLSLVTLPIFATADFPYFHCSNTSTYMSSFQQSLNSLLSQLSSSSSLFTTRESSAGEGRNILYGQFMCLFYVPTSDCVECVKGACQDIQALCPKNTEAILWKGKCQLRYSKLNFSGKLNVSGNIPLANKLNSSEVKSFRKVVNKTVADLIRKATSNTSMNMYALENRNITDSLILHSLVQCTTDLTLQKCRTCLQIAMENISATFYSSRGVRLLSHSCFLQYELYPLVNNFTTGTAFKKGNKNTNKVMIAFIASAASVAMFSGLTALWITISRGRSINNKERQSSLMDIATILIATDRFSDSNFLGRGGFGSVYKGILPNEQEIAVKRLSFDSNQGIEEFTNEILFIMRLQHKNLVRLLGFCALGEERLLVYEFMPNGSLQDVLDDPQRRNQLDWKKRVNIIIGIARGMLYLHQDSRLKIIHRDLKTSNILLDTDMRPKISDFGTARSFIGTEEDISASIIVGTFGYMAPEYVMEGSYSIKSDVYSFGVIMMEILTGNSEFHNCNLLPHVWDLWNEGQEVEAKDPLLTDSRCSEEFSRYVHIGLLCVQESSGNRPYISSVIAMLKGQAPLPRPERPPGGLARREGRPKLQTINDGMSTV